MCITSGMTWTWVNWSSSPVLALYFIPWKKQGLASEGLWRLSVPYSIHQTPEPEKACFSNSNTSTPSYSNADMQMELLVCPSPYVWTHTPSQVVLHAGQDSMCITALPLSSSRAVPGKEVLAALFQFILKALKIYNLTFEWRNDLSYQKTKVCTIKCFCSYRDFIYKATLDYPLYTKPWAQDIFNKQKHLVFYEL